VLYAMSILSLWLDHANYTCERHKIRSSSLCSLLQPPITSSLFVPSILLNILFSSTLSICSSLNVRDQVSHQHKTIGKMIIFHVLIFTFFNCTWEDNRFWN
jgi:hypothetical protein